MADLSRKESRLEGTAIQKNQPHHPVSTSEKPSGSRTGEQKTPKQRKRPGNLDRTEMREGAMQAGSGRRGF